VVVAKVCGIETEYGVSVTGAEIDPITTSSLLVSAYSNASWNAIPFDLGKERPFSDARGVNLDDLRDPEIDYRSLNTVLVNGARYYVDHAHPEYSSPECASILQAVAFDLAGDEILRESVNKANSRLPEDVSISVYKNNSDGKGNSYGCHENYLVDRNTPFSYLASCITTHFVTRQVFCGSGKVGNETTRGDFDLLGFQLSQRADFFEEEIGLETTIHRPIVNTRDEPHCDSEKYRRLHVIVGDANMCQFATFLKLGTTALILSMIEHGVFPESLFIAHPVSAIKQISRDSTLSTQVLMHDGRRLTALDIQDALIEAVRRFLGDYEYEALPAVEVSMIMDAWEETIYSLRHSREKLHDRIDWIAKQRLVSAFALRHQLADGDPRLKAIDLQYHALDAQRSIAIKAGLRELVAPNTVRDAVLNPPHDTRAYFRGRVLQKWPSAVVAANWDSMVFDLPNRPLVRIEMNEPLRGTRLLTKTLLDTSNTIEELLAQLASDSFCADSLGL
jgi:Pup amidohydrolase